MLWQHLMWNDRCLWLIWLNLRDQVKEQSEENLARGRKIYEPPRFMSVNQALEQLVEVIEAREDIRDALNLS